MSHSVIWKLAKGTLPVVDFPFHFDVTYVVRVLLLLIPWPIEILLELHHWGIQLLYCVDRFRHFCLEVSHQLDQHVQLSSLGVSRCGFSSTRAVVRGLCTLPILLFIHPVERKQEFSINFGHKPPYLMAEVLNFMWSDNLSEISSSPLLAKLKIIDKCSLAFI